VVYNNSGKDFILNIFGCLAENKENPEFKITCTKIFCRLLDEKPEIINEYFRLHLISNMLIYILNHFDGTDKNLIEEFLYVIGKNLKYLKIKEFESDVDVLTSIDEINRLRKILAKYEDKELTSLIDFNSIHN
jgi:hypothetical protein